MDDCIKREALLNWAREFYPNDKVFQSAIINAPAADVAPIVHGQFIHIGPRFAHGVDWWKCNICSSLVSGVETQFSYCPHCGAKMDGGGNDAADRCR